MIWLTVYFILQSIWNIYMFIRWRHDSALNMTIKIFLFIMILAGFFFAGINSGILVVIV